MSFLQGLFGPPNVKEMKAKRDVKGLIKALEYKKSSDKWEHRNVREAAAKALGELKDARAVEPLIAALKDSSSNVRKAADALGVMGAARSTAPLLATLNDNDFFVRKAAKEALGKIDDGRAS